MEYTLFTSRKYYECDDGCCSDSWDELKLYKGEELLIDTDVYLGYNSDYDTHQEILDWVNKFNPELQLTLYNCEITR